MNRRWLPNAAQILVVAVSSLPLYHRFRLLLPFLAFLCSSLLRSAMNSRFVLAHNAKVSDPFSDSHFTLLSMPYSTFLVDESDELRLATSRNATVSERNGKQGRPSQSRCENRLG